MAVFDTHLHLFDDGHEVSSYAAEAKNWAVANGLMSGSNNELKPKDDANRAETAQSLMKFVEHHVK